VAATVLAEMEDDDRQTMERRKTMKRYIGIRTQEGCSVEVIGPDGRPRPLEPRLDIRNHSPDGFEWGYGGSGPAQLALAILADHLGDDDRAQMLYQRFKFRVVGNLAAAAWTLTAAEIDRHLAEITGARDIPEEGAAP
jgi:hypothetical protein